MEFLCLGDWKCREMQLHQDLLQFYVDVCSKRSLKWVLMLESLVIMSYCVSVIKYMVGVQAKSSLQ